MGQRVLGAGSREKQKVTGGGPRGAGTSIQLGVSVGQKKRARGWVWRGELRGRDLMQRSKVRGRGRQLGGGAHMQPTVGVDRGSRGGRGDLMKRKKAEEGPTEDGGGVEGRIS